MFSLYPCPHHHSPSTPTPLFGCTDSQIRIRRHEGKTNMKFNKISFSYARIIDEKFPRILAYARFQYKIVCLSIITRSITVMWEFPAQIMPCSCVMFIVCFEGPCARRQKEMNARTCKWLIP